MSDNITAARPYAKAVFETAQLDSSQTAWSEILGFLSSVVVLEDMAEILESPAMSSTDKGELLIEVCGAKCGEKHRNFINLLAENGRLILLADIFQLFEELCAQADSKIDATVLSAYPLSEAQLQAMTEALKKKLGCDVTLVTEIDKTLIGGVIIKAGDLVIDGSTQARLSSLASALTH